MEISKFRNPDCHVEDNISAQNIFKKIKDSDPSELRVINACIHIKNPKIHGWDYLLCDWPDISRDIVRL